MNEKLKKAAFGISALGTSMLIPVMCFAAEGDASTIISTAATTVSTDALAALTAVAPIGIKIGGAYLVLSLGWRFFKGLAK